MVGMHPCLYIYLFVHIAICTYTLFVHIPVCTYTLSHRHLQPHGFFSPKTG